MKSKIMRKFILLTFSCFIFSLRTYAQEVSCNDLLDFIKSEGYKNSSISNWTLNSSWLYEVTAYSYDYKIYVVAEIKKNEYSLQTNTYIFCGIPSMNWSNFQFGTSDSYGERFHKYIIDYKCNCY